MSVSEPHPTGSIEEIDSRLLNALASLNHVGMAINRMGVGGAADEKAALQLIVESAIQVVPGASALIYTYDGRASRFAPESRVSAGILAAGLPGEHPRPDGMGVRAIQQRRLVLSYEELDLSIDPKKYAPGRARWRVIHWWWLKNRSGFYMFTWGKSGIFPAWNCSCLKTLSIRRP
jgi:hypothetical protein